MRQAEGRYRVLLEVGWQNVGTKSLTAVGLNLLIADDVAIRQADTSGNVEPVPGDWILRADDHELNRSYASLYLARRVDAPLQQPTVMHLALDVPGVGRSPIEFKLFHHELDPRVRLFMLLTLPGEGEATLAPPDPTTLPVER